MKNRALIVFFVCSFLGSFSQSSDTALLNRQIKKAQHLLESNIDSAYISILQNINNSYKNKYAYGYSRSNSQLVQYYFLKGQNDSALLFTANAIKYARISKDTNQVILTYLQSARIFATANNYPKAIENCLIAQNYADKKKDNTCEIKIAHDLGFIYSNMNLHEKSIYYFRKGLNFALVQHDTFNIANLSARIGGEFNDLNRFDSALHYNKKGLALFKLLKHKRGIGATLTNLNESYGGLKNYAGQIITIREALKIRTELGDQYAVAILKNSLAESYLNMRNNKEALATAKEVEALTQSQGQSDLLLQNYFVQYSSYLQLEKYKEATAYAIRYINTKDSIFKGTSLKDISELQTKYETDKKEKEILLLQLEKKNVEEKTESENAKRNLILFSVIIIALLIAVFTVMLYLRFKKINEQNLVIEKQKQVVDEKNKEIIDSINYARTIQQALIPSETEIKSHTKDAFVIFKPKDIVSGDFYWCSRINNYLFLAVADCTGHGVPGAFMSMMGMSFLNEIVNEKSNFEPSSILNELREKVTASLNKEGSTLEKHDGMDMVLLRFDYSNYQLKFSGANNSIYHLSGTTLKEISGDKMPVGLYFGSLTSFSEVTLALKPGDKILACTDGLPDQFGGPKNKKFMYKKLEKIIVEFGNTGLIHLKNKIETELETWQGPNEQIDDINCLAIEV